KKAKIKKRKEEKKDQWISHIEEITGMKYEGKQRQAIETALTQHVMILTGGPGTGKTTTLKAIIHLLREQGDRVLLAAPTGRAAKRMSELTGEEASTIHRLLEVQWDEDDAPYFERNAYNPLEADAVILDEVSMVDSLLFSSFLDALPAQCRLIMVGDTNQLPPVGAGNVLGDLIDSEVVPTIQLNHVFRQALQSRIVTNAHKVVSGQLPEFVGVDSDFFLIPCSDTQATLETILDVCSKRLPAKYGMNIFEGIQVISPGKKGKLGTEDLNTYLQDICNPEDRSKPEWTINGKTFRTGDKVMQMRNNYNIEWFKMDGKQGTGIFNGDIGTIVEIQKRNDFLVVRFDDDREATYSHEDAEDLDLAYAITVHKSQGSEFEIVVLSLFDVPKMLCYRNLFYTAITRAKKLLVIVGNKAIVGQMVQNDKKTKRYSAVKQFILELKGD
ncbi:MAG: Flp pilus assembly complex ATPase component TadA, partial [Clostridia bacterium]|nr:Flp pilus assembly complex ATPase component TadA [Clostridia bacterium]